MSTYTSIRLESGQEDHATIDASASVMKSKHLLWILPLNLPRRYIHASCFLLVMITVCMNFSLYKIFNSYLSRRNNFIWGRDIDEIYQIQHSPPTTNTGNTDNADVLIITNGKLYSDKIFDLFSLTRLSVELLSPKEIVMLIQEGYNVNRKYILVVIADIASFTEEPSIVRHKILDFCSDNKLPMLVFAKYINRMKDDVLWSDFKLGASNIKGIESFNLEPRSQVWNVTKPGFIANVSVDLDWTGFQPNPEFIGDFRPLVYANTRGGESSHVVALEDIGERDSVRKIIIGKCPPFPWFMHLLFWDSLKHLTAGNLVKSFERHVLVDIEDVFLKKYQLRITGNDVDRILTAQKDLKNYIRDFKFNLGFYGNSFRNGTEEPVAADNAFIANKDEFWWFSQSWNEEQPHLVDDKGIIKKGMRLNRDFAKVKGLPLSKGYSVPPFQSGVFPVLQSLYAAWSDDVSDDGVHTTSSTLYHKNNDVGFLPLGFVYKNVQAVPRFELFKFDTDVDDLVHTLDDQIYSGTLLVEMLYNRVQIIRTSTKDYVGIAPAIYTLQNLMLFIRQWTNLKFVTEEPGKLANRYFDMYPADRNVPVWQNPCLKKSLLVLWPPKFSQQCSRLQLPDLLIAGPQKSGTSALSAFLEMHPSMTHNIFSPETADEVQFFSSPTIYERGIEWYMSRFPSRESTNTILIDKSATYYKGSISLISRMKSLLPNAKIVINLLEPTRRTQSHFYQFKAHDDNNEMKYTIAEMFGSDNLPNHAKGMKARILDDSTYVRHIRYYLQLYPPQQLIFVDASKLVKNPIAVMADFQQQINVQPKIDYSKLLRFDKDKGFYCMVLPEDDKKDIKCMGASKGREYPDLDEKTAKFLHEYFTPHNIELAKLLQDLNRPLPMWLREYAKAGEDQ